MELVVLDSRLKTGMTAENRQMQETVNSTLGCNYTETGKVRCGSIGYGSCLMKRYRTSGVWVEANTTNHRLLHTRNGATVRAVYPDRSAQAGQERGQF